MAYEIKQNFISRNRSEEELKAVGMVVHETADPGTTAENEQALFNSRDRQASAHAFVDWDSIMQTVPFNKVAWHAGRTANHRFVGIELCRPAFHDTGKFTEVWNRAVWLFSHIFVNILCVTTVTKDNLMSHKEVSLTWHESTHVDPDAYFAEYGKTVDDFRDAVQLSIDNMLNKKIKYQAHVQNIGWQDWITEGDSAGTFGKSLRLEALVINSEIELNLEVYIEGLGWQPARRNGEVAGTVGMKKQVEAVKITTADKSKHVQYQVHIEDLGWMNWASDGAVAGTTGKGLRLEAIRIKLA